MTKTTLETVHSVALLQIVYLPHTVDEMNAPDEMITPDEVRNVVFHGEVIEDYREDVRGHSCLMLGYGANERPIHVVCVPKPSFLAIITVYVPTLNRWKSDWKTRRRRE